MQDKIREIVNSWLEDQDDELSGVITVTSPDGIIYQQASGYRNKAEELPNNPDTVFAIASGTKLFTGLAVCKLLDSGKLSLTDKLRDLVKWDLGAIDRQVTVHHLLTHTSGVGDYIDEESENEDDEWQALYDKYPPHLWTNLEYYLQMITHLPPKFAPGERYGYSNCGYVLLGLIVEAVSGKAYQQFVQDEIITPLELTRTGFFRMDNLPGNTALGYLEDGRTNIHGVPVIGGSDGGLFTCAADIDKLWRAIYSFKVLSESMTVVFLRSYETIDEDDEDGSIETMGLGVFHYAKDGKVAHFNSGGDSGVGFVGGYYPEAGITVSCFSNTGWMGFYDLIDMLIEV